MAPRYCDLYNALGQLGRGIDAKRVDRIAKKFDLDKADPDGNVPLAKMAWEGAVAAVHYLIARGVDVDRVDKRWEAPALALAMTSNVATARARLQVVKALLAAGADPDLTYKRTHESGTILDHAIAEAHAELRIANSKAYDGDSRKTAAQKLASLGETIPLVMAAGGTASPSSRKRLAKLGLLAATGAKRMQPLAAGWVDKVEKLLASGTKRGTQRDTAYRICTEYLSRPEAIAGKAWATLVERVIASGPRFEDVAEDVYGVRVAFLDDEGTLAQGWENHVVLDHVLDLLALEATLASPAWTSLVEETLSARRTHDAAISTAVDEFFSRPWVKKHAAFKKLRALEKTTRS